MKFVLQLHMNPSTWESLPKDEQDTVVRGHEEFIKVTRESGEFVATKAMSEPGASTSVRVRDGETLVADGSYLPVSNEFMCGYYVVDVAGKERAIELAALIPEAKYTGVDVRSVLFEAGVE